MTRRDAGRAAAIAAAMAISACAPTSPSPVAPARPARVVSLDYCADQFVLKLADRAQIAAVSPDAEAPFSSMRAAAVGVPKVRPAIEDVLALRPDLVVRSYGGGAGAAAAFARAGVPVVEVGYEDSLAGARANTERLAAALGHPDRGAALGADMQRRLEALAAATANAGPRPRALYFTTGGVTTGPGGVVDEMMRAAGFANYETQPGWRPLPLERLAADPPDVVIAASFGARAAYHDFWSAARHPIARDLLATRPVVALNGAMTSCSAWVLVDGIEAMHAARP
ncbi:MAG: ABC transporter substrate-binding protein [Alphaproteobacteria bacterium]|nr:ABC transporter substrate-binding protein [Alphaproteobacteria bacterium]